MEEDIKKLLEENLKVLEETRSVVQKTATYLKWVRFLDLLKLFIIIIPIIAAWLYLPRFMDSLLAGYGAIIPGLEK